MCRRWKSYVTYDAMLWRLTSCPGSPGAPAGPCVPGEPVSIQKNNHQKGRKVRFFLLNLHKKKESKQLWEGFIRVCKLPMNPQIAYNQCFSKILFKKQSFCLIKKNWQILHTLHFFVFYKECSNSFYLLQVHIHHKNYNGMFFFFDWWM